MLGKGFALVSLLTESHQECYGGVHSNYLVVRELKSEVEGHFKSKRPFQLEFSTSQNGFSISCKDEENKRAPRAFRLLSAMVNNLNFLKDILLKILHRKSLTIKGFECWMIVIH